ncbi:MAG: L-threonylcarbamoyladenylate synthase [Clostridia bacterium]|nr:L-threonylcarbamoyladenylate synthase [Clostridia bacterium]
MKTEIIQLDENKIEMDKLRYAAEILRGGGLVAFPTETVYGLGANALDEKAVEKIFEAKGRPSDNPLIVHISGMDALEELVNEVPSVMRPLVKTFWPGPLTVVLRKSGIVPRVITAGLNTVAVRMPEHPVALQLIRESGVPVAAPSANTSGKPSPTMAKHVIEDLSGKVDVIIDAGISKVGLESTVLDLTVDPPMILRPGGISLHELSKAIGEVVLDPALMKSGAADVVPKAPGMKYTHYSPKADVIIVEGELSKIVKTISKMAEESRKQGKKVGILATEQTKELYSLNHILCVGNRDEPQTIAANLFNLLREFDRLKVDVVFAEAVDRSNIGFAIMNRLTKAAGYNIIKVE